MDTMLTPPVDETGWFMDSKRRTLAGPGMLPSGSGIGSERAREAIILFPRATRESSSLPGASMRAQARSRRASRPHACESPRLGNPPAQGESPLTMRFRCRSCPCCPKRAERRPDGPITRKTSADRADPAVCADPTVCAGHADRARKCLRPQTPDLREKHRTRGGDVDRVDSGFHSD